MLQELAANNNAFLVILVPSDQRFRSSLWQTIWKLGAEKWKLRPKARTCPSMRRPTIQV